MTQGACRGIESAPPHPKLSIIQSSSALGSDVPDPDPWLLLDAANWGAAGAQASVSPFAERAREPRGAQTSCTDDERKSDTQDGFEFREREGGRERGTRREREGGR